MYDCIIIGAGISGCSLAFELSKYQGKVLLLDKNNDVADETTKANSAIIHAGYDPKPDTLMARYNVEGCKRTKEICKDLDVHCHHIGSLVVAFSEGEKEQLEEIYQRGLKNGVEDMRIVEKEELHQMEPNLNEEAIAALYAPSAAIVNPWQLAIALSEVAINNGVEIQLNEEVTKIEKKEDSFVVNEKYETKMVVNAAGVNCDTVTGLVTNPSYEITPNKGEYYLLDKSQGTLVNHVIFQCPTKEGKGVLVSPTVHGNLIVGPTSENSDADDYSTTLSGLSVVRKNALKSVPSINFRENIRTFAGIRARSNHGDFIVGEDENVAGFYSMAAMASPGLSSAVAIAEDICSMMQKKGFFTNKKEDAVTTRKVLRFNEMSHEQRKEVIEKQPAYGRIICRCESISEGEILDAIKRCPHPISIDGIKRRCNAGMGRCQGGFCGPRVQEILSRQLGIPQEEIVKDKKGSQVLFYRTKEDMGNE